MAETTRTDKSSKDPGTPRYVKQVHKWIKSCNRRHGDSCVPDTILERPPDDVPLWLIDTHQQCIVPGLSADRYLALSYVWPETRGSADDVLTPPRTLLLNDVTLTKFQIPGAFRDVGDAERLPSVIRHALYLTDMLGERYLWVDRLCIVQNDPGDGGTLSQVGKMDKIYGGAYLTIIAAASEEMYEKDLSHKWPAFKSVRRMSNYKHMSWYPRTDGDGPIRKKPLKIRDKCEAEINVTMSERYDALSRSRWATRGWTYQEQILCKRAIVLTESGFFWDCQCAVWDSVDLHPGQSFKWIAVRADLGRQFSTRWWPDFGFYLDLVCRYNGRDFSYPQDAMLGFMGILSALGTSFPGGFIHGLPRVFFDHALLWQPFSTATRRIDRTEDGLILSTLPSWSWCGWQVFVDPRSHLSGLSYVLEEEYRDRAGDWRTTNLVQWHLSVGEKSSEPILEPLILDQHTKMAAAASASLPAGWTRHEASDRAYKRPSHTGPIFTHAKAKYTYFRHPIPLRDDSIPQIVIAAPAHLTCSTTIASFLPATVLKLRKVSTSWAKAPAKISVFDDKNFNQGPPADKHCPVLVLQQHNGAFAGLLRLMSDENINETTSIELIAISCGSASVFDLYRSFEWRIFEIGEYEFKDGNLYTKFTYKPDWISEKGKYALLFDVTMTFSKKAASQGSLGSEFDTKIREWESPSCDDMSESGSRRSSISMTELESLFGRSREATRMSFWKTHPSTRKDVICEFYNVLWIEHIDGIAYRRACGWVPKYIWEAHATGPVEVKLG